MWLYYNWFIYFRDNYLSNFQAGAIMNNTAMSTFAHV